MITYTDFFREVGIPTKSRHPSHKISFYRKLWYIQYNLILSIDLRPQWVVENFKTFRDTVETLISVLFKSFLAKLIPCFTTSWFRLIQRSYAIFILLTNAGIL